MRTRWLRAMSLSLPLILVIAFGCSKDDKPSDPGGGEEQMTAAEFEQEMEDITTSATSDLVDCKAGYLLDPAANADMFEFLQTEVLPSVAGGGEPSQYYGTWNDTSPTRNDGEGITKSAATPANAVRLILVGTDTLGTPLNGDLTLLDVAVVADTVNHVFEVSFDAELHEYTTGDEAEITLEFELHIVPDGGEELADFTLDLTSSGSICDVAYNLDVAAQDGDITIGGWYQGQTKVTYQIAVTTTETDTTLTATLSFGTTTPPRVRVTLTANPGAAEDCLTGQVYVRGRKQADIVAAGCGTDDVTAYMVVEGESLLVADVLGGIWTQLEDLLGNMEEYSFTGMALMGPAAPAQACSARSPRAGFPAPCGHPARWWAVPDPGAARLRGPTR